MVTVMSTGPAVVVAGEIATIELLEFTRNRVAAVEPKRTPVTLLKFVPLIVTTVEPAVEPWVTSRPAPPPCPMRK